MKLASEVRNMDEYEVYAECRERSWLAAESFLDSFLRARTELADDYRFPEMSDNPRRIFQDAKTLIEFLKRERGEEYAVYWKSDTEGDPHQGFLVFTSDGGMIAGLASRKLDPDSLLRSLAKTVGATHGIVVLEERPPGTLSEFRKMCETSPSTRIVDGRFFSED